MLQINSSPHIHCGTTVNSAMRDVILALSPALIASVYFFGLDAILVLLTAAISAMACEHLCQILRGRPSTIQDGSALLTGLLLACCLPPQLNLGIVAFGSCCAIIIGKQVFGGLGYNIFNPAHIGRAVLLASMPMQMTLWREPLGRTGLDAVTVATPLAKMRIMEAVWQGNLSAPVPALDSLTQLFVGNVSGSLGETSALAILLGGLYLIYKKHIDWRIPAIYILTVALICQIYACWHSYPIWFALYHVLAGGLMIGSFFMATDWVTCPLTRKGRLIFALGLGIITALIRLQGSYIEGVCYSILIMNMCTPLIDSFMKNKVFGKGVQNV